MNIIKNPYHHQNNGNTAISVDSEGYHDHNEYIQL